jgi:hypothetical protein
MMFVIEFETDKTKKEIWQMIDSDFIQKIEDQMHFNGKSVIDITSLEVKE